MNILFCPAGGLGNLVFQYIITYILEKKYNCNVLFTKNNNYWRGDMDSFQIFKHLKYVDSKTFDTTDYIEYNELHHYYYDIELNTKNNYKMSGYYQSYKYSQEYIDEIKQILFQNISDKYLFIKQVYASVYKNKRTCLIHVRRGDYLKNPSFLPTCNDYYYIHAINSLGDCHYLVLSDDMEFLLHWPLLQYIDYTIIDLQDPEEILIFMSLCENFIIANSSLSLLGYLFRENKNARLFAPKKWFENGGPQFKIEDIVPSEGIIL